MLILLESSTDKLVLSFVFRLFLVNIGCVVVESLFIERELELMNGSTMMQNFITNENF